MPSKQKDELKFKISPTLFETELGEPLCFYIRPGPVKRELMPLIKAAGGLLCTVQKPGAILLKDPDEKASFTDSTAHWYVSTKYIHDCIEKNEKLNIEDYRLNPESTTTTTKQNRNSNVGSPAISGGRTAYTPEEDDAILRYVSKRRNEIGGNRLWQEMTKKQVTCHSWQSMKYRYRVQLAHRLSEYKEADVEKENKKQKTEQSEAENKNEESASQTIPVETEDPDNNSLEMDVTQISLSADSQDEQANVPQAECNDNEACDLMEMSKLEIDETPEQQEQAPPEPDIDSSEKDDQSEATSEAQSSNLNDKSPHSSVNRPITRQQFELENMPYVKRLRSSGTPPESPFRPSHKQTSRTKSFSSPKSDPREAQPPLKKVRRKMGASVAEETEEESEQRGPSEKAETDEEDFPVPPKPTEKKAEKRKLGILEMATKEFEDDSESESDSQYETPGPSTSIEAVIGTSSIPDPSTLLSENQKDPGPVQAEQEPPPTTITTTADTTTATSPPRTPGPAVPEPTTKSDPPIEEVTSKAHLFIFQSESQEVEVEEDSQSLVAGPSTSTAAQTNGSKTAKTPSLTQDQLEEDVQFLKAFMKETNQDLVSVAKAILKASGDLILARELLADPTSFSGPSWTRTEDQRLCSEDPTVRQELLTKYGEEGVAKRLMFLELEK